MSITNPTEQEQEEMNKALADATFVEKAKIGFINIPINEMVSITFSLTEDEKQKFLPDFVNTLAAKVKKDNSRVSEWAFELLARAFHIRKNKSSGGQKAMANRWKKKAKK